jgi:hypothetical protein
MATVRVKVKVKVKVVGEEDNKSYQKTILYLSL